MSYVHNEVAYENAIRRNIIANARKTFCKTYPRADEVENFLYDCQESKNDFLRSMHSNLFNQYGKLTEKQYLAVCNVIDKYKQKREEKLKEIVAQKEKSKFVSEVGKRLVLTNVLVEKIITIDAPQFFYNDRCSQEIYLMRDENDNRIVFRTKAYLALQEGEKVTVKATIKEHKEYNGEKQTVIQRPVFS